MKKVTILVDLLFVIFYSLHCHFQKYLQKTGYDSSSAPKYADIISPLWSLHESVRKDQEEQKTGI